MQCVPRGNLARLSRHLFSPPITSSRCLASLPLQSRRHLLTLAIETSCDDTCVAILEKDPAGTARLHFNEKITSDSNEYGGIHPLVAIVSHTAHLAPLVEKALRALPEATRDGSSNHGGNTLSIDGRARQKPDFVSVTRGPGMQTNLAVGLHTAKGLALAWGVPLMAVNHMQAHAITPRLVHALERRKASAQQQQQPASPCFPFLSLLVSGGHTMLVHSRALTDHGILANTQNIAVGDMLDKCARLILPTEILAAAEAFSSGMYGRILEDFAFPGSAGDESTSSSYEYNYTPPLRRGDEISARSQGFEWALTPPLAAMGTGDVAAATYDFSGLNGQVQSIVSARPDMGIDERRALAQVTMRLVFEHLASRVILALGKPAAAAGVDTLVLSGGVASNKYLRHVMRALLQARGFAHVDMVAPPVPLCTDNAAMIAWTAMEMFEQGWRSELGVGCLRRWPLDPAAECGGILGASGWYRA